MADYNFEVDVYREKMGDALYQNEEQFIFVLTYALARIDLDAAIDLGQICDDISPKIVVEQLRALADAIIAGQIT